MGLAAAVLVVVALSAPTRALEESKPAVHHELETEFTAPLFPTFSPRLKTSIGGDLSLTGTVSGWTTKIKERIAGK